MAVTIRDIAREVGVSDATVSLSLSEHPRISKKTREKVRKVADRLNYFPNLPARILRNGGSQTIGFLVSDISNPLYASMIQQVEKVANEAGYQVIIAESQWNSARELKVIESLVSSRVKGLMVILTEQTSESVELLERSGLPVIAVDTRPNSFKGAFVGNDLVAAGRMAVEHLFEVGCRHPLLLTASLQMHNFSAFVNLKKGFQLGLKKMGYEYGRPPIIPAGLTIQEGASAFGKALEEYPKTDGILCANDLCAFGAMMKAEQLGINIGGDLRVIGIDNLEFSSLPRISLTSICQPYDQIALTSTHLLIDHIENKVPLNTQQALTPELIVRESTLPSGADASDVLSAPVSRRNSRSLSLV